MKQARYTDDDGRIWVTLLPEEAPDTMAEQGVPHGPPSMEPLGLPLEVEVRLHNELVHREILTEHDVRRRQPEVQAALMAALKVDALRIAALYAL